MIRGERKNVALSYFGPGTGIQSSTIVEMMMLAPHTHVGAAGGLLQSSTWDT